MLEHMDTTEFINLTAGPTRGTPGHHLSTDDELRALIEAQNLARDLARRVAAHTNSPVQAALFAHAAEDAHRTAAHARLLAAGTARRTLAHELPETTFDALAAIHQNPSDYLTGVSSLPHDPATVPTGRLVFKDTTEFLAGFLHIGFYEARERVRAIDRLLPGTDIHGIHTPARFPVLAKDLADGTADPAEIGTAARKLDKLTPQINQHPNPTLLAGKLEDQVAESVRREDPRTTAKLLTGIQTTLEDGAKDIPEEILRTKTGMFYRGTTGGLGEFLLRTLPRDTEALLAMCASTDNPRTKAGDRDGLLAQARTTTNTDGNGSNGSNGSNDQSTSSETAAPSTSFPDFLVDPATGTPLTDPETIRNLSLDPEDPDTRLNSNGNGLVPLAKIATPDTMNTTTYGPDGLTPPQRHLQGLLNLLKTAGQARTGKKTIGLPSPTTVVIATLNELRGLAETHGITGRGQKLTPAELRQTLCNGGALPITLNGKSQILDLGREERFFPDYMREAILGIYGGCLFPGCTVPPEHCEIDHDEQWATGGTTNINQGRPLCTSHHHARHTGLLTVTRDLDGLFSVILPKFMDPEQQPRRNAYWRTPTQNPPLF
ncbi:hypothetical protein ADIAG_01650 [Paeniglutamicibacter gangotriensis Lz1y]|uniref:HNH nuclease domain-containing protein n=2 Tax=Paeniglutamicibacter gangotriensis TaxID=254787 RepID=M7MR80_9MICC|nr:hypothetical protein ADIAG_01650 [Paeniglutamicibacter gangotriensis Lz1y]